MVIRGLWGSEGGWREWLEIWGTVRGLVGAIEGVWGPLGRSGEAIGRNGVCHGFVVVWWSYRGVMGAWTFW